MHDNALDLSTYPLHTFVVNINATLCENCNVWFEQTSKMGNEFSIIYSQ